MTTPASKPTNKGIITEETALLYCTKRSVVSRGIDNIKKGRGEITTNVGSLRMKSAAQRRRRRPSLNSSNQIAMNRLI